MMYLPLYKGSLFPSIPISLSPSLLSHHFREYTMSIKFPFFRPLPPPPLEYEYLWKLP